MNLLTTSDLTRAGKVLSERARQLRIERTAARWPKVLEHCRIIRESMVKHD